MNIFKILNTGDGRIKETNVSAFLAYLLNPKQDHGLGDAFLKKVLADFMNLEVDNNPLEPIFYSDDRNDENAKRIVDLSVNSSYNVDVWLEKALKAANKDSNEEEGKENGRKGKHKQKEIVDIIIKITDRRGDDSGAGKNKKEDVFYFFKEEKPVCLILLENKIRPASKIKEQLKAQYQNCKTDLKKNMGSQERKWHDKICTILVSTSESEMQHKFDDFIKDPEGNKNSIHLKWDNKTASGSKSIKDILIDLLEESAKGIIAPIPSYTSETIKAFINFIENSFSSNVEDQRKNNKQGHYDTLADFKKNCKSSYTESTWALFEELENYLQKRNLKGFSIRHTTGHPFSIFKNIDGVQYPNNANIFRFNGAATEVQLPACSKIVSKERYETYRDELEGVLKQQGLKVELTKWQQKQQGLKIYEMRNLKLLQEVLESTLKLVNKYSLN